ncbi:MAG: AAA family ATPase, partial [Zoogloeaceae bacterium]|nr:AAA family ATPase [Zoogloeaceae bacterium]
GYPDRAAERALLAAGDPRQKLATLPPLLPLTDFIQHQEAAAAIFVAPALLDYVQDLLEASRRAPQFHHGLSPRCGLGLLAAARAWAYLDGRKAVLPDDVQVVLPGIAAHRLRSRETNVHARLEDIEALLRSVPIP